MRPSAAVSDYMQHGLGTATADAGAVADADLDAGAYTINGAASSSSSSAAAGGAGRRYLPPLYPAVSLHAEGDSVRFVFDDGDDAEHDDDATQRRAGGRYPHGYSQSSGVGGSHSHPHQQQGQQQHRFPSVSASASRFAFDVHAYLRSIARERALAPLGSASGMHSASSDGSSGRYGKDKKNTSDGLNSSDGGPRGVLGAVTSSQPASSSSAALALDPRVPECLVRDYLLHYGYGRTLTALPVRPLAQAHSGVVGGVSTAEDLAGVYQHRAGGSTNIQPIPDDTNGIKSSAPDRPHDHQAAASSAIASPGKSPLVASYGSLVASLMVSIGQDQGSGSSEGIDKVDEDAKSVAVHLIKGDEGAHGSDDLAEQQPSDHPSSLPHLGLSKLRSSDSRASSSAVVGGANNATARGSGSTKVKGSRVAGTRRRAGSDVGFGSALRSGTAAAGDGSSNDNKNTGDAEAPGSPSFPSTPFTPFTPGLATPALAARLQPLSPSSTPLPSAFAAVGGGDAPASDTGAGTFSATARASGVGGGTAQQGHLSPFLLGAVAAPATTASAPASPSQISREPQSRLKPAASPGNATALGRIRARSGSTPSEGDSAAMLAGLPLVKAQASAPVASPSLLASPYIRALAPSLSSTFTASASAARQASRGSGTPGFSGPPAPSSPPLLVLHEDGEDELSDEQQDEWRGNEEGKAENCGGCGGSSGGGDGVLPRHAEAARDAIDADVAHQLRQMQQSRSTCFQAPLGFDATSSATGQGTGPVTQVQRASANSTSGSSGAHAATAVASSATARWPASPKTALAGALRAATSVGSVVLRERLAGYHALPMGREHDDGGVGVDRDAAVVLHPRAEPAAGLPSGFDTVAGDDDDAEAAAHPVVSIMRAASQLASTQQRHHNRRQAGARTALMRPIPAAVEVEPTHGSYSLSRHRANRMAGHSIGHLRSAIGIPGSHQADDAGPSVTIMMELDMAPEQLPDDDNLSEEDRHLDDDDDADEISVGSGTGDVVISGRRTTLRSHELGEGAVDPAASAVAADQLRQADSDDGDEAASDYEEDHAGKGTGNDAEMQGNSSGSIRLLGSVRPAAPSSSAAGSAATGNTDVSVVQQPKRRRKGLVPSSTRTSGGIGEPHQQAAGQETNEQDVVVRSSSSLSSAAAGSQKVLPGHALPHTSPIDDEEDTQDTQNTRAASSFAGAGAQLKPAAGEASGQSSSTSAGMRMRTYGASKSGIRSALSDVSASRNETVAPVVIASRPRACGAVLAALATDDEGAPLAAAASSSASQSLGYVNDTGDFDARMSQLVSPASSIDALFTSYGYGWCGSSSSASASSLESAEVVPSAAASIMFQNSASHIPSATDTGTWTTNSVGTVSCTLQHHQKPTPLSTLLSYRDHHAARINTLELRTRIRALLQQRQHSGEGHADDRSSGSGSDGIQDDDDATRSHSGGIDAVLQLLRTECPSVLSYPPHAALISLFVSVQRIIDAVAAGDAELAFTVMQEQLMQYVQPPMRLGNEAMERGILDGNRAPIDPIIVAGAVTGAHKRQRHDSRQAQSSTNGSFASMADPGSSVAAPQPSTASSSHPRAPAMISVRDAASAARALHVSDVEAANVHVVDTCLPFIRAAVALVAETMCGPDARVPASAASMSAAACAGSSSDLLSKLQHPAVLDATADVICSAVLEHELAVMASRSFAQLAVAASASASHRYQELGGESASKSSEARQCAGRALSGRLMAVRSAALEKRRRRRPQVGTDEQAGAGTATHSATATSAAEPGTRTYPDAIDADVDADDDDSGSSASIEMDVQRRDHHQHRRHGQGSSSAHGGTSSDDVSAPAATGARAPRLRHLAPAAAGRALPAAHAGVGGVGEDDSAEENDVDDDVEVPRRLSTAARSERTSSSQDEWEASSLYQFIMSADEHGEEAGDNDEGAGATADDAEAASTPAHSPQHHHHHRVPRRTTSGATATSNATAATASSSGSGGTAGSTSTGSGTATTGSSSGISGSGTGRVLSNLLGLSALQRFLSGISASSSSAAQPSASASASPPSNAAGASVDAQGRSSARAGGATGTATGSRGGSGGSLAALFERERSGGGRASGSSIARARSTRASQRGNARGAFADAAGAPLDDDGGLQRLPRPLRPTRKVSAPRAAGANSAAASRDSSGGTGTGTPGTGGGAMSDPAINILRHALGNSDDAGSAGTLPRPIVVGGASTAIAQRQTTTAAAAPSDAQRRLMAQSILQMLQHPIDARTRNLRVQLMAVAMMRGLQAAPSASAVSPSTRQPNANSGRNRRALAGPLGNAAARSDADSDDEEDAAAHRHLYYTGGVHIHRSISEGAASLGGSHARNGVRLTRQRSAGGGGGRRRTAVARRQQAQQHTSPIDDDDDDDADEEVADDGLQPSTPITGARAALARTQRQGSNDSIAGGIDQRNELTASAEFEHLHEMMLSCVPSSEPHTLTGAAEAGSSAAAPSARLDNRATSAPRGDASAGRDVASTTNTEGSNDIGGNGPVFLYPPSFFAEQPREPMSASSITSFPPAAMPVRADAASSRLSAYGESLSGHAQAVSMSSLERLLRNLAVHHMNAMTHDAVAATAAMRSAGVPATAGSIIAPSPPTAEMAITPYAAARLMHYQSHPFEWWDELNADAALAASRAGSSGTGEGGSAE